MIKYEDLISFKCSQEFNELDKYYRSIRTLDLFNNYGTENAHTSFIANLLAVDNPFTNDNKPFLFLINLLSIKPNAPEIFKEISLNKSKKISNLEVFFQKSMSNKIPDITIEFKLDEKKYVVIIEAKLTALENDNQTKSYRIYAEEKYQDYERVYVYLSLDNNGDISDSENWLRIDYQELLDYVLIPSSIQAPSSNDIPLTLDEYIKSYSNSYERVKKDFPRIAYTPKEIELAINIWNKHFNVLDKIKDTIINSKKNREINDFFASYRDILIIIYELLQKIGEISLEDLLIIKNDGKLNYFKNKTYNNVDFLYTVIKDIVRTKNIKSIDELKSVVVIEDICHLTDDLIKLSPSDLKDYETAGAYRTKKRGQTPIKINGKECYYRIYIPKDYIKKFVENVIREYPEYKDILYLQK